MNERIKELAEQASCDIKDEFGYWVGREFDKEKFAELIVKECARLVEDSKWNLPRGCTAADQAKYVKEHFGVEECRGWICPKCGVDRTKDVCPQGHMAAVEGKCPMIGVAQ